MKEEIEQLDDDDVVSNDGMETARFAEERGGVAGDLARVDHTKIVRLSFSFHFSLAVLAINALITALIWAAAYGEIRCCIPVYASMEIPFLAWIFYRLSKMTPYPEFTNILLFIAFFAYCGLFIPLVIRFHVFLGDRNRARRKHIYGRTDGTFP